MHRLPVWCRRWRGMAITAAAASLIAAPVLAQVATQADPSADSSTEVLRSTVNQGGKTWNVVLTARRAADSPAPFSMTLNDTLVTLDSTGSGPVEVPGGPKFVVRHPKAGVIVLACPNEPDPLQMSGITMGGDQSGVAAFACAGTTSVSSFETNVKWNRYALRVWPESPLTLRVKQVAALLEGIQEKLQSRPPAPADSSQRMAAEFTVNAKLNEVSEALKQILLELDTAP